MLDFLKKTFLNTRNQKRESYTWNMVQSLLISVQSVIMLMVINRTNSLDDSGVFSIAYAVASLMYYLAEYGVRKYQITDVREKASFGEYHTHRVITCLFTAIVSIVYVVMGSVSGRYSIYKCLIILIVCFEKALEAYCDVFFARFQQQGRLDVAAKASTYRIVLPMVICLACLIVTHNMLLSMAVWLVLTVLAMLTSFILVAPEFGRIEITWNRNQLLMIFKDCLPLFLGNFLLLYVGNAPKYAIDAFMGDSDQARYNFIFMPVFVIGLLANFIFNPILVELASEWNNGNRKRFRNLVIRQLGVITGITALAIAVAMTIGCPVLGIVFHADLSGLSKELTILMVGGGMLAFANFFIVVVTVLRGQKYLIAGYCLAAIAAKIFAGRIVKLYGIPGACTLYTVLMTLVTAAFAVILLICIRKSKPIVRTEN